MKTYTVSIVKRFKVIVEAESLEQLDEILYESSDEIASDEFLDYTDWEVMAVWEPPTT